jgi:photosystem II stability/assembly factor-like uncharacterized protein
MFLAEAVVLCVCMMVVSSGHAQTWMLQTNSPGGIIALAPSADGSKLFAASYGGIYSSTNSGSTWIALPLPFQLRSPYLRVASSAYGDKLVLASFGTNIFTSINSGATWITNYVTSENWAWTSVASSADGNELFAANAHQVAPGISFFGSTNSGMTWFVSARPARGEGDFRGVVMSPDGSKLSEANAWIYTSIDDGATWTSNNVALGSWSSVAMSADGTKLIAAANPGGISTSTDSGMTWTSNNVPDASWYSVASSVDGSKLVAVGTVGIYTSLNAGATWVSNNVPGTSWYSVAMSSDGCKMIAGGSSGVWTAQTTPSPRLNFTVSDTGLVFSWIVPAMNFVLRQSPDLVSWSNITNTPALNLTNLNNELSISPTDSSGFFRLISQ